MGFFVFVFVLHRAVVFRTSSRVSGSFYENYLKEKKVLDIFMDFSESFFISCTK